MSRPSQQSIVLGLEQRLLAPEVRREASEVERLLADDFLEIGASGRVYDRASVVASLLAERPAPRGASAFQFRWLSDELLLLVYRLAEPHESGAVNHSMRSSLWRRDLGRWRLVFHQGTALVPA